MQATSLSTAARVIGLGLVLVLAAAFGILAGNLIQGRSATNFGYPAGWQGGAAVPVTRTADAAFSLDAVSQLQAIRDTGAADAAPVDDEGVELRKRDPDAPGYQDYGLRHSQEADDLEASRYGPPGR